MSYLKSPVEKVVDSAIEKYGLPEWVRPYVYKYAKGSPISAVKFAISLLDVKRKKGEVTKSHVTLPNGTTFEMQSVLRLLNIFFYGEENISRLEEVWATKSIDRNAEYERRFLEMSEADSKRTRAIKNLIEGLGHPVGECPASVERVFDAISRIEPWKDRIVATGIVLRYSYATTFGMLFYKVFYPVSPEFMRSFGKAFENKNGSERWDTIEAERMLMDGNIDSKHVIGLARNVLSELLQLIESNMGLAKELGLEKEVRLLSEISIAYPFQRLSEMGIDINVEKEVSEVKKLPVR